MGRIKGWYRRQPPWVRRVNVIALVIVSLSSLMALKESGPEFHAIFWHYRHGNHVSVNGVTFPVNYYWWAPTRNAEDDFDVFYAPGPFRRDEDTFTAFEIQGWRGMEEVGAPGDLVQKEIRSYEKSGYRGVRTFRTKIQAEDLECVEELDERLPGEPNLSCYGDGPIYHVFFVGSEESRARFDRMLADAR